MKISLKLGILEKANELIKINYEERLEFFFKNISRSNRITNE